MTKKKPPRTSSSSSGTRGQRAVATYELPVELSEKQIESDVSNYFGYLSSCAASFGRFRLLDVDEQVTGADKSFVDGAMAYYLQFKKPCGLRPVTPAETSKKLPSNASTKQQMRRFRHVEKLDQEPYSICFHLHPLAKTATALQHNILLSYEKPPHSRAIYVCPLELTSVKYMASMTPHCEDMYPFLFHEFQWIRHGAHVAHAARSLPYLRGHAAIVPHAIVSSADHYYSFSYHATDVAFHSPINLSPGPTRLSDYVGAEVEQILAADTKPTVGQLVAGLRETAAAWIEPGDGLDADDDFGWLHKHGLLLRQKHGIRQMVLLRRRRQ